MNIINLSLEMGIFPENLKMAKIIPIFRADDSELYNLSNFFERV
jgi:hypothetical protein